MSPHLDVIDRSVEKTHIWLNELMSELGNDDARYAMRALRSVLHAVRDRLTVDEAAQVAAQLPELVRGIYYESWDPSGTPARYRSADEFLERVARTASLSGHSEASYAAAAVMRVLRRHVSAGEVEQVLHALPEAVRRVLEAETD